MQSYSTYYTTKDGLKQFIKSQNIVDNDKLLIQIFTGIIDKKYIARLLKEFIALLPSAHIIGSTTDGEICSGKVSTKKTVISFTQFETTQLQTILVEDISDSYESGKKIANILSSPSVKVIISFIEGLHCNGEAYLDGIHTIDSSVLVAGGMAGDNSQFVTTYLFIKEKISSNAAVAVALINPNLCIYTDYSFNWLSIGKQMKITKVESNRIYTIDDIPAYDVYKKYLGEEVAKLLPSVGVEFPLIIQKDSGRVARAVLTKHDDGSLSFAGNIGLEESVTFGYGDADTILNHSKKTQNSMLGFPIESIFIYSCMARRRFMPELIESEIMPFQDLVEVSGFFTYGEFFSFGSKKKLLNQTMTILGLSESPKKIEENTNKEVELVEFSEYQKSIKALTHLLNITTIELAQENQTLLESKRVIEVKKESLKEAQKISHIGSWEVDLLENTTTWSEENYHIYRVDPQSVELSLEFFISLIVEEDRQKVVDTIATMYDGSIQSVEMRAKRTDGVIITLLANGKVVFNENGDAIRMIGTTQDITERVKLRERNEELAALIEDSSSEVYIVDKESYRYLYANNQALKKLGYSYDEILNMTIFDINKNISQEDIDAMQKELSYSEAIFVQMVHTKKDGSTYPSQSYIQYKKHNNKEVAVIFDIDISQMHAMELKEKRQAQILEQIHDSVVSTDLNDIIIHWNNGASLIHGYEAEEMLGESIKRLYLPEDLEKFQWMKDRTLDLGSFQGQIRKITKEGSTIYTDVSLSILKDENGEIIGITRYSQDITQKKLIEDKLKEQTRELNYQAYYDALTRLPNRSLFDKRLQEAIVDSSKSNKEFALLFIDLDNFKQINDTLGHHYGDDVLKIVAKRFLASIDEKSMLSRLGGDEFTILVYDNDSTRAAVEVAQNIINNLKPLIILENHELHISASIGISLYPQDSIFKSDLLKYADTAMYYAKNQGRDNYQFYSADMTKLAFEKARMEKYLYDAIKKKQLIVYYQPQIDSRDSTLVGMEALVRWEHPELGFISPANFIPLAEEIGLITELDSFVMYQAMSDVKQWYKEGLNPGVLSLNLSITQLKSEDFIDRLKQMIIDTSFNAEWLELEVTEGLMMDDPIKSIEILQIISDMGIKIAIDDFGTGYSSLAYLKRLPVNKLKIDRSFIKELPYNDDDCAISQAIIALAKSLNLTIIAEGVEEKEQIDYLVSNRCFYMQGFYYSKAIPKEDMRYFIKNNNRTEDI